MPIKGKENSTQRFREKEGRFSVHSIVVLRDAEKLQCEKLSFKHQDLSLDLQHLYNKARQACSPNSGDAEAKLWGRWLIGIQVSMKQWTLSEGPYLKTKGRMVEEVR